jgi:hypothetical protein
VIRLRNVNYAAAKRWDRTLMRRLTKRFGHRALFIWLIAATVSLAHQTNIDHLFHTFLPVPVRIALWAVPAIIAMAITRTRYEWIAFVLLALPPGQRAMSYMIGSGFELFRFHNQILAWDYLGRSMIYLLIIFLMWLVGTWPNPISDELSTEEIWLDHLTLRERPSESQPDSED